MKSYRIVFWLLTTAMLWLSIISAIPQPAATNMPTQQVSSPALDRTAESMTSMADMCKTMMEMEMKG